MFLSKWRVLFSPSMASENVTIGGVFCKHDTQINKGDIMANIGIQTKTTVN
jgi:hypothetical protein